MHQCREKSHAIVFLQFPRVEIWVERSIKCPDTPGEPIENAHSILHPNE
jgi:hypothetical protein